MITYVAIHFIILDLAVVVGVATSLYKRYKLKKACKAFGKETK